ncbi:hypothetical protein C1H46_034513 [Malus baccata]|uniref:Uncharacterized protein n=1 Tax=Malus baccata TaxID=106549 RepID=A0A540L0B3_MALBA|nr:hypothetical protein C1H46_034513 [Malus baccata]
MEEVAGIHEGFKLMDINKGKIPNGDLHIIMETSSKNVPRFQIAPIKPLVVNRSTIARGSNLIQIDDSTRLYPEQFSRDLEAIGAIDSRVRGRREQGIGGVVEGAKVKMRNSEEQKKLNSSSHWRLDEIEIAKSRKCVVRVPGFWDVVKNSRRTIEVVGPSWWWMR